MKKPLKTLRTTVATIVILAIASMGVWAAWRAWPAHSSDLVPLTMKVEAGDWTINITASGELQAAESVAVAVPNVPVNGLRLASAIPDGRRVNKGDVLVEFDPAELNLQALDHRSSLAMANQKITQGEIGNEIEKADLQRDRKLAELELQKINEFLPRDVQIYSRREIVEGELDKSYSEQKIVFADARLELKDKVYSLDEAILLLERKQAENKISQVEKGLAAVKLLAPRAGIVVYNNPGYYVSGSMLTPGRVLWSGLTLLNLVNPDQMEARCYVLEKDAGELRAGEQVTVTLDPYPGVPFGGRIKNIDRLARPMDSDSPVKYFQTVIALDKTDTKLMKPGVKVKAAISALLLKSAIVVPRSAIAKKDAGAIIFVQTAVDRFEAVPVKLGRGDLIKVEIVEGIKARQIIALNPPDMKQE
jgi:multidrug efflux pump subunit AcrA (membrane-fusion protein)